MGVSDDARILPWQYYENGFFLVNHFKKIDMLVFSNLDIYYNFVTEYGENIHIILSFYLHTNMFLLKYALIFNMVNNFFFLIF